MDEPNSNRPFVKNAADRSQVKEAEKKVRRLRERELNDVRFILSSQEGRRFLWRYLEKCKVFETSFTGNSTTFFNEGMRNVGLMLIADINEAEPEAYLKMMNESKGE